MVDDDQVRLILISSTDDILSSTCATMIVDKLQLKSIMLF